MYTAQLLFVFCLWVLLTRLAPTSRYMPARPPHSCRASC